jgi:hypothetical protein
MCAPAPGHGPPSSAFPSAAWGVSHIFGAGAAGARHRRWRTERGRVLLLHVTGRAVVTPQERLRVRNERSRPMAQLGPNPAIAISLELVADFGHHRQLQEGPPPHARARPAAQASQAFRRHDRQRSRRSDLRRPRPRQRPVRGLSPAVGRHGSMKPRRGLRWKRSNIPH